MTGAVLFPSDMFLQQRSHSDSKSVCQLSMLFEIIWEQTNNEPKPKSCNDSIILVLLTIHYIIIYPSRDRRGGVESLICVGVKNKDCQG